MPELPEVETIRQDLETQIIGAKISNLSVSKLKIIKESVVAPCLNEFKKILIGCCIKSINRRGKLLILELESKKLEFKLFLLIHLN